MHVKHLPKVPHNGAALSVDHDDAVQVPHAAAGQRCNAALGSGHGFWRHCTVEIRYHDDASKRSCSCTDSWCGPARGFEKEPSHTRSSMSGRPLSSIQSSEPTFIAQLGQRAGFSSAACWAARGAQQGSRLQLAAPAAQQDVRLVGHRAGRCDGVLTVIGQAVHKAACLHAPQLHIPILQRCRVSRHGPQSLLSAAQAFPPYLHRLRLICRHR